MRKTLRLFPMLLSLMLLFGHQLVPHMHEAPADEMRIGKPETVNIGWLSLVFSLDQGAEHLEHFRQISSGELQPNLQQWALPVFRSVYLHLPLRSSKHVPIYSAQRLHSLDYVAQAHQLRGPPSC